jgi:hypothetical protein
VPAGSPRAARRYRVGPALVAIGYLLIVGAIITAAAIGGVRLAEMTENKVRPQFVTPSPSPHPCPRQGGPPPC